MYSCIKDEGSEVMKLACLLASERKKGEISLHVYVSYNLSLSLCVCDT